MASVTVSEPCQERQEMLQALLSVLDRIVDLVCLEIAAAVNGKMAQEIESISRALDEAVESKLSLLNRYKSHVQAHRCN